MPVSWRVSQMSNPQEQPISPPFQRPLHRLRLLSDAEILERQPTLRVPTPGAVKQQEEVSIAPADVPIAPLFAGKQREKLLTVRLPVPGQGETLRPGFGDQAWKPETFGFDIDDDPEFEKRSTLPMMVLKDIAKKKGEPSPAMKSEISGAASNAAIVGFGSVIGYVLKYGNNLLIQRGLGPGLFGLYSVGLSLVTLIASIFDLGLDNAMIRYIAIYRGKKQTNSVRSLTLFCTAVAGITGLLGAVIVLYFAPALANLEHTQRKQDIVPLLQVMAPLVPLLCLQTVWIGGLQGFKEFKRRVFVQRILVPVIVFLLMGVALIFFRNILAVAIVTFLSTLISALINLYFLFRAVARTVEPGPEKYEVRTWLSFATPNFLTTIVNTLLDSIDTLLLAFFVPAVAIGQYSAALKISGFILLPLNSLNVMFTPTIAELHGKGESKKLEAMYKVVTHWAITLSLPVFIVATVFSVPVLEISGKGFVAASPLLIILGTGSLVSSAVGASGFMILMTGHPKFSFFNSIFAVVLNVGLGLLLTPHYGAMGTAISTAIAVGTVNLVRLVEVRLLLKMHPYRRDTFKPLGAGLISGALTGGLYYLLSLTHLSFDLFRLHLSIQLVLVPVFLASYIGLLALFKISPEDQIVVNRLRGKFGRGKNKKKKRVNIE